MKTKLNDKGFTLVELIVVIAVLAIITVVSVPFFVKYVEKSRIGTDRNAIGEVTHAAEAAFVAIDKDSAYTKMKIRIDADGYPSYQSSKSRLVQEVKEIIAEDSYIYKSEFYRGKTVEITVNPDTGIATYVDPDGPSWSPSDDFIIGGLLEIINRGPLTPEQAEEFDKSFTDLVTSVDEFFDLPRGEQKEQVKDALVAAGVIKPDDGTTDDGTTDDGTTDDGTTDDGTTEEEKPTGCVAVGSEVTLADGSVKKIEELTVQDKLLAFNHEEGQYVEADILFIAYHEAKFCHVMNLEFSDGSNIKLLGTHALFDTTLNQYVRLSNNNFTDYIGHSFAMQDGEGHKSVELKYAFLSYEYIASYSLATEYYLNNYVNGFLANQGEYVYIANAFKFDSELKYKAEEMRRDIENYGLYQYEDFAEYISKENFEILPLKYLKVTEGKEMISKEGLEAMLQANFYFFEMLREARYIEY